LSRHVDQATSLLNQEATALDDRKKEQQGKRKRVKEREATRSPATNPTNKEGTPLHRSLSRPTSGPERRTNAKHNDTETESLAWKVGSPSKDPSESMYKVPVDVVPLERAESGKQRAAEERNTERVAEANRKDEALLSEYLISEIESILPKPTKGPDDAFDPGEEFLARLTEVASTTTEPPKRAPVEFATSSEALQANDELLREYDYDLEKLINAFQETTLGYGSEFRPVEQLKKVLGGHPQYEALAELITKGMDYRFNRELTEEERRKELQGMLQRGNHKSTEAATDTAARLLEKDVTHGFSIPVSTTTVAKIKGAMVQPLGLASQFTLAEDGSRKIKNRLTQDLSFSLTDLDVSVNARIDMERYPEMFYGWCMSRIIHFIVALRLNHPTKRIFIAKYDYSDAYRRMAHAASAAAQSITVLLSVAYIAIRLTFGGSPNPPSWCLFSEMVTDLANEIACCSAYDPRNLRSPSQPLTPIPTLSLSCEPLAGAFQTAVCVSVTHTARVDSFIDDLINCFLDTKENREKQPHVVPLAMHCTSRPHAGSKEPITRRDILSGPKLVAEGTPAEEKIVLGWMIDTHRLQLRLPADKYEAWSLDLSRLKGSKVITYAGIDGLVGKLNHAAFLIPLARHFLSRFRDLINRDKPQRQQITVSDQLILDVSLWELFLSQATAGISMNRVTIRQPTRLGVSDSCPFGVGGFLLEGRAWRIRIPESSPIYGESTVNNFLEFLGMVVNVWLMCLEFTERSEALLVVGDNTSAIGWLFRSSKVKADSLYYEALQLGARQMATLVINSDHCLASQHTKGEANLVADLLSWSGCVRGTPHPLAEDDPSDIDLTLRFHSHLPQLIPKAFKISPLPNEVLSWVTLALRTVESSWIRNRRRVTRPETE
jgi:hypothetical protein